MNQARTEFWSGAADGQFAKGAHLRPRLGRMAEVPLASLGMGELGLRKTDLTLSPSVGGQKYGFGEAPVFVPMWTEEAGYLKVPRKYGFTNMGLSPANMIDDRTEGVPVSMQFQATLRPAQEEPVQNLLREVRSAPWSGAILESPCGSGKTVMMLRAAAELGKATLVIVHTEVLMDQWRERIRQFLGLPDDKIGQIQQNVCSFADAPITVGMIHSLAEKDYPAAMYRHFGTIIYDEVHRVSAPFFSKAVPKFWAKYRLGASATPRRADGLENVFLWHIGDVVRGVQTWEVKPKVYQIQWTSRIHPDSIKTWGKKEVSLGKLMTVIGKDARRNIFLAGEITRAAKSGRKILVLSDRIDHLKILRQYFQSQTHGTTLTSGFVIGGMDEEARNRSSGCNVLFGTFQYVKEGYDCSSLDTLYLATPHTDVEQAVGRILRQDPDKKEPLVVDVVDSLTVTRAFAAKRRAFYEYKGFDVLTVHVPDGA